MLFILYYRILCFHMIFIYCAFHMLFIYFICHIHFVSLTLYFLYLYTCHILFSFIYYTVHILSSYTLYFPYTVIYSSLSFSYTMYFSYTVLFQILSSCTFNCILSSHSSAILLISCCILYAFHLHILVIYFFLSYNVLFIYF